MPFQKNVIFHPSDILDFRKKCISPLNYMCGQAKTFLVMSEELKKHVCKLLEGEAG